MSFQFPTPVNGNPITPAKGQVFTPPVPVGATAGIIMPTYVCTLPPTFSSNGAVLTAPAWRQNIPGSSVDNGQLPAPLGSDDTAAMQAALIAGAGGVISGGGRTYKITDTVSIGSNTVLRDLAIDMTGLGANKVGLKVWGAAGAAQTLAADVAQGGFTVTVADGSAFAANGLVYLASTDDWSPVASGQQVKYGELVRVRFIAGNVLTLQSKTLLAYTLSAAATATPIAAARNVVLDNVSVIGAASGLQTLIDIQHADGVIVRGGSSADADRQHIRVQRSARVRINDRNFSGSGANNGLDYGVAIGGGSYDVQIDGVSGDGLRHLCSTGGSAGVSRHIYYRNCHITNCYDAGLDFHNAVHEHGMFDCTVDFSNDADPTMDGLFSQGSAFVASRCVVTGSRRHGVVWQPVLGAGTGVRVICTIDNIEYIAPQAKVGTSTSAGISVSTTAGLCAIDAVSITGFKCAPTDTAIAITSAIGVPISRVAITAPLCLGPMVGRGIHIIANADIDGVLIDGGDLLIGGQYEVVFLQGTATGRIKNVRTIGNALRGAGVAGSIGLRAENVDNLVRTGNQISGVVTPVSIASTVTGYMAHDGDLTSAEATLARTIANDAVVIDFATRRIIKLETEAAAATDNLATLTPPANWPFGGTITLRSNNTSRDVTVQHNVGNIRLGAATRVLSHPYDRLVLQWGDDGIWYEIGFADSAA